MTVLNSIKCKYYDKSWSISRNVKNFLIEDLFNLPGLAFVVEFAQPVVSLQH